MASSTEMITIQPLSISNQIAPRGFVRTAYCFPFEESDENCRKAYQHMRAALDSVARDYPFLAGTIEPETQGIVAGQRGRLQLKYLKDDVIPLSVGHWVDTFGWTYDELKAQKFPQSAFVGQKFLSLDHCNNDQKRQSVLEISLIFIKNGLIMTVCNHHSVMDGGCRKRLFDLLSAYTKAQPYAEPLIVTQVDTNERIEELMQAHPWEELLEACDEKAILADTTGPCEPQSANGGADLGSIEMSGKIFRFADRKLKELRKAISGDMAANPEVTTPIQQYPSAYMTLAALTWAHVTRARFETENFASEENAEHRAKLMTPVSWKDRALKKGNAQYFGNAIATPLTVVPVSSLFRACAMTHGLSELIRLISDSISKIDEEYMCRRIALYKKLPDIRRFGLKFDLRNPQDYTFNTWRWLGGQVEWDIPGARTIKAEAVRRVAESHKLGAIVILPATEPGADNELYVELPRISMDRLCQDKEWMRWVDEIVG